MSASLRYPGPSFSSKHKHLHYSYQHVIKILEVSSAEKIFLKMQFEIRSSHTWNV